MKKLKAPVRIDFAGGWSDVPYLLQETNGFVSNCTIQPYITLDEDDNIESTYPQGIGLSTSTAVKALELLKSRGIANTADELAELLFLYENVDLHWAIGRQDMYSIVHGGYNCFRFQKNGAEKVEISIPEKTLATLEERVVLFYSGESRNAQRVVAQVYDHQARLPNNAQRIIKEFAHLGYQFSTELKENNFDACAEIVSHNWELQKELASNSSNSYLDSVYTYAMQNGARGGKLCGAGSGGCFVFITDDKEQLSTALSKKYQKEQVIDYHIEPQSILELNQEALQ
jgi:D-glycero-alpha-D-manno-heptose-7-phosphate kinase